MSDPGNPSAPSWCRAVAPWLLAVATACGVPVPPSTTAPVIPSAVIVAVTRTPPEPPATATPASTVMPPSPTPSPSLLSPQKTARLTAALIEAAESRDVVAVAELIRQGADLDGRDAHGRTPLMAATQANAVEVVRGLLDAGADVDLQDNRLDNPFLYAGAEGLLDILRLTIAAGADTRLTNRFGGTALIPAAERGHVEVVRELLTTTDVDVNHVNNLGWTALLEAIVLSDGGPRHQTIVALLLDHGADPAIADFDGVTPLAHARRRGFAEIAALLEARGAPP